MMNPKNIKSNKKCYYKGHAQMIHKVQKVGSLVTVQYKK